jgi:hypothetical protein
MLFLFVSAALYIPLSAAGEVDKNISSLIVKWSESKEK